MAGVSEQSVSHLDIIQQESAAVLLHLHQRRPQKYHPLQSVPCCPSCVALHRIAPQVILGERGRSAPHSWPHTERRLVCFAYGLPKTP